MYLHDAEAIAWKDDIKTVECFGEMHSSHRIYPELG